MFAKFLLIAAFAGAAVSAARLNNGYGAPPPAPSNGGFNGGGNNLNGGGRNGLNDQYSAPGNNIFDGSRSGNGRGGNGGFSADNNGLTEEEAFAQSIPGGGVPGEDFPVLSEVPETGFSCEEQEFSGYYADDAPEAGCQVFHICQLRENGQVQQDSFLCPNGTVFNQQYLVCDWWYNFDCATAQDFYSVNEQIGIVPEGSDNGFGGRTQGGANGAAYGNGNGGRSNGNGGRSNGSFNSGRSNGNGVSNGYSAPPANGNGNGNRPNNGYGY